MIVLDPVLFRQLPVIRQIILNETWLEAERRGCCVNETDRVVRENVCRVVLLVGAQMRETAERELALSLINFPWPDLPEAA